MKKRHILLALLIFVLASCGKKGNNILEDYGSYLTNSNSKQWRLKKLYVNGNAQTLTPAQLLFAKTYKSDNSWVDTDGYSGTYSVESAQLLKETTINATGGNTVIDYKIYGLSANSMDLEYSYNQQTYRFVYEY
jgi:hypothetical protein